jgi:MFS family permease
MPLTSLRANRCIHRDYGGAIRRWRENVDHFTAGPTDDEAATEPAGRRGRRLLWLDGLISNISESTVTSFLNPAAMAFGLSNSQIGFLSAALNAGSALGLLPGARLEERTGRRKLIFVLTNGLIGRLLLIAFAMTPLLLTGSAVAYGVIGIIALRSFFVQLGYPAWSALLADLVPRTIRGRYFGSRNIALAIAALASAPLAGVIIQWVGPTRGYQVGFVLAGVIGLVAASIYAGIPEPPHARVVNAARGRPAVTELVTMLRQHPRFLAFSSVALVWNLALMVAGPYFSVYMVRNLQATPTQIGLFVTANGAMNIVGQRLWGRLNDRRGAAWVMRLTGLLIPIIPILWALVPSAWWLLLEEMVSGLLWSGYTLASFNLMLSLTPGTQRPRFVALYQSAVFGAACVGPLVGSLLASHLPLQDLFWISAAGRLVAALLFLFTVRGDVEVEPLAPAPVQETQRAARA